MNRMQGVTAWLILLAGFSLPTCRPAGAGDYDVYLRETPRVSGIVTEKTAGMVEELQREIQRVLDAGPLAPLRMAYADIPYEGYWIYYEPGRILTTLAYAYPHLRKEQQEEVKKYARELFANKQHAPWTAGILGPKDGANRELHNMGYKEGRYPEAKTSPTLHVLYGLWLYGERSGEWEALKPYWDKIKERYRQGVAREAVLYGQMSAHVAMARLARKFGDDEMQKFAEENAQRDFDEGKDTAAIQKRVAKTRFKTFTEPRNDRAFAGQPWVFLDAAPEVLRFLKDHAKDAVVQRINAIEGVYPLWWLHQAPYFTRWTGDEGIGVTPELIGMCFPVERWIKETPPEDLARFMKSAPVGIGDCYWLEALVQAIESFGTTKWSRTE